MKGKTQVEWKPHKGFLAGLLTSLCVTLLAVGTLSLLISNSALPEQAIRYGALAVLLLATMLGALISITITKSKRILTGAITAMLYGICLLACTALFFGGQYDGVGVTLLVLLGGGTVPGLLGMREKKHYAMGRKRIVNR